MLEIDSLLSQHNMFVYLAKKLSYGGFRNYYNIYQDKILVIYIIF